MDNIPEEVLGQWGRVLVGLRRVERVYTAGSAPISWSDADYDVRAFFVTCHQLHDFVQGYMPEDVAADPAILGEALRTCRDVAVIVKHAPMQSRPMSDLGGSDANLPTHPSLVNRGRFAVGFGRDDSMDALELARRCVQEWIDLGFPADYQPFEILA